MLQSLQLESNMIMPMIQMADGYDTARIASVRRDCVGLLFGFLGVLVAAPLTVVAIPRQQALHSRHARSAGGDPRRDENA